MKLLLKREPTRKQATLGKLYSVDTAGHQTFICNTLEDTVRLDGQKIYGKTAIPAGSYSLVLDYSPHFNTNLPHVLNVPNFAGVRMHGGNTPADTLGCILCGVNRNDAQCTINDCAPAVDRVMQLIQAGYRQLQIVNPN